MSDKHEPSRSDAGPRKGSSPTAIVLSLLAFVLSVMLGIYATIPAKEHHAAAPAPVPDPTVLAIQELQTSLHQVADQLKAVQQTVSSDRADTKQLSDRVRALSEKLEAVQQSFTSMQQAPAVALPAEPARPKHQIR
jgi:septal ring factor EnvC (AmiA/AmiB activator)